MQFTLNYVNLPHQTIDLDKTFKTMEALQAFVGKTYPNFTSYQIVATASKHKS